MPIMSYLAWPAANKKDKLIATLRAMPGCEVQPAEDRDLLVVVTDTQDEKEERQLQAQLKEIQELACLALVAGYSDVDNGVESSAGHQDSEFLMEG